VTVEKLDAMLDEYMGDEARKARLDAQLESYFTQTTPLCNQLQD